MRLLITFISIFEDVRTSMERRFPHDDNDDIHDHTDNDDKDAHMITLLTFISIFDDVRTRIERRFPQRPSTETRGTKTP